MTLDLTKRELTTLALALSASAKSAALDDRPTQAIAEHRLAARLWDAAGYAQHAAQQLCHASRIRLEQIAPVGDEGEES